VPVLAHPLFIFHYLAMFAEGISEWRNVPQSLRREFPSGETFRRVCGKNFQAEKRPAEFAEGISKRKCVPQSLRKKFPSGETSRRVCGRNFQAEMCPAEFAEGISERRNPLRRMSSSAAVGYEDVHIRLNVPPIYISAMIA